MKWSRLERRFNGSWQEGSDRVGKISLRLVDGEIRGAWTTSKKSEINAGTPRLADLSWVRPVSTPETASAEEYLVPYSSAHAPQTISLKCDSVAWSDVLKNFCAAAGCRLDASNIPAGTFTYSDYRKYSAREVAAWDEVVAVYGPLVYRVARR